MSALSTFLLTLRTPDGCTPESDCIEFASLEAAYCDVCEGIPDTAAALLRDGIDPMACSYLICDRAGALMMDVPFTDLLRGRARRDLATVDGMGAVRERGRRGHASALHVAAQAECNRSRRAIERARALMSDSNRVMQLLRVRQKTDVDPRHAAQGWRDR